jgi:hypothetical protein
MKCYQEEDVLVALPFSFSLRLHFGISLLINSTWRHSHTRTLPVDELVGESEVQENRVDKLRI